MFKLLCIISILAFTETASGSSLMESESDASSEETVFVNQRRINGIVVNNNTIGHQQKPVNSSSRLVPKAKISA
jgi:hypothetical protein